MILYLKNKISHCFSLVVYTTTFHTKRRRNTKPSSARHPVVFCLIVRVGAALSGLFLKRSPPLSSSLLFPHLPLLPPRCCCCMTDWFALGSCLLPKLFLAAGLGVHTQPSLQHVSVSLRPTLGVIICWSFCPRKSSDSRLPDFCLQAGGRSTP